MDTSQRPHDRTSSTSVIIPSRGRPEVLYQTVALLQHQTRTPAQVILSVTEESDVCEKTRALPRVLVCTGPRGSAVQRNTGIAARTASVDHLVFMDDDTVLDDRFIEMAEATFVENPSVAALSGTVIMDGAGLGRSLSYDEARHALSAVVPQSADPHLTARFGLYGCAAAVRAAVAAQVLFDGRLQAYALLEDLDFGARCARWGEVVTDSRSLAVHLGVGSGRVRGLALGVAQVLNPWYLHRKGVLGHRHLVKLWSHYVAANCVRLVVRRARADRRGRLRGNLIGLGLVLTGRGRPEAVSNYT